MMATTELEKVPPTIQSRSQVFELKMIGIKAIADQLQKIAAAEQIQIDDAALTLLARAGDGSMRDAQSSFDQVIAFAGQTLTADDVTTVLGLVRRDLLMDIVNAVADEDGAGVFEQAARAIEAGYDLRLVIREISRLTRDLLVVKLDPSRLNDAEIAAESERDRIKALAARFSNEDLMRAFDVLTKAELDIRASTQPRYHLELALLRWIHLRRLVPLSDLIEGLDKGGGEPCPRPAARAGAHRSRAPGGAARCGRAPGGGVGKAASTSTGVRTGSSSRAGDGERVGSGVERRPPERDSEDEEAVLRHGDRPGAADRCRRRHRDADVRPAASHLQAAARAEPALARRARLAAGGT